MKKKIFIVVLVVVLAGGGFVAFNMLNKNKKEVFLPVSYSTVKNQKIETKVTAKGEVSLKDKESIYSNVSAEIEEILVKKDDEIKKGDALVRFKRPDNDELKKRIKENNLNLKSAELNLKNLMIPVSTDTIEIDDAKANIKRAEQSVSTSIVELSQIEFDITNQKEKINTERKKYEDVKIMYEAGGVPKNDLDQAELALKNEENNLVSILNNKSKLEYNKEVQLQNLEFAKDRLVSVEKNIQKKLNSEDLKNNIEIQKVNMSKIKLEIEDLNKQLNDFEEILYSKVDGTLTKLNVSKGEVVPTEKVLMEVSDLKNYDLKFLVNERNINKIKEGQVATIEAPFLGDEKVIASVLKIGKVAESVQRNNGQEVVVPVYLSLNDNSKREILKPGFTLETTIITKVIDNALVVPIIATIPEKDDTYFVYLIDNENTLVKKQITLGEFSELNIQVSGLNEGDKIVEQPDMTLKEGTKIEPINPEEKEKLDKEKQEMTQKK